MWITSSTKTLSRSSLSFSPSLAVLKHFPQWPERRADALREAACNYRGLKNVEQEVSSFEDNQKESLAQATRRMQALQDRLEQSVNGMERMRESTSKKYRDFQISCDWMMDSGLIGQNSSNHRKSLLTDKSNYYTWVPPLTGLPKLIWMRQRIGMSRGGNNFIWPYSYNLRRFEDFPILKLALL